MRVCTKDNCNRKYREGGFCSIHYMEIYNPKYRELNKIDLNKRGKEYRLNHPEIIQNWRKNNKEHIKKYNEVYRQTNPRTRHYQDNIELQIAINNVKKRDHNTCKWYKCGLTHREAPIHVHHIFPRSEYPELELIEQYMICYCANHHGLFHRYRGDVYYRMIKSKSLIELEEESKV